MPVTFSARGPIALPTAVLYTGPGDVVGSALAGWSLRASSAATAGTKAVRLIRSSDSAQADISTLANGNLNTSDAFFNGSTYKVVTLYDQASGANTYDVTQPTDANRPTFTLNALNGHPTMTFVLASSMWLKYSGAAFTQAQPLSYTAIAKPGPNASNSDIISCNSAEVDLTFGDPSTVKIYAGASLTSSVTLTSKFYALQALFSSTLSKLTVSGTSTVSDAGLGSASSSNISIGSYNGTVLIGDMDFVEGGIWGSDTSANFASLDTNQTAYWGPF